MASHISKLAEATNNNLADTCRQSKEIAVRTSEQVFAAAPNVRAQHRVGRGTRC